MSFAPVPEPHGKLVPPDRLPPTAIGTLTPPPPRNRGGRRALGGSGWNRAMLLLILLLLSGGATMTLVADSWWMRVVGAGLFAIGAVGLARLAVFVIEPMLAQRRERKWLSASGSRG